MLRNGRKAGKQESAGKRLRHGRTEISDERLQKIILKKAGREKYGLDTNQNTLVEDPTSKPNQEL